LIQSPIPQPPATGGLPDRQAILAAQSEPDEAHKQPGEPQEPSGRQEFRTLRRVAEAGLDIAHPVRFRLASSPLDREKAYRLRYEAVIRRGWGLPEDYPGGLESDGRDDTAVHVLGFHGEVAVATARLIFPEAVRLLPTEETFHLRIKPLGQVVDMGRVVVAPSHSDVRHRVLAGLMAFAWLEIARRGFAFACGAFASPAGLHMYRQMGFKIEILAPSQPYWGEMRYPILFDVPGSARELARRWASGRLDKEKFGEGDSGC
jgi:hypothetical protein